jgi:transcription initiation factor IIF auxiliary subunit
MHSLRFPVEDWEQWAAYVKANGGSITGLIVKAVNEHLARKRRKGG